MGAARRPNKPICPLKAFPVPTRASSVERRRNSWSLFPKPAKDAIGFRVVENDCVSSPVTKRSIQAGVLAGGAGRREWRNHNDCLPFSPSRFQIAAIVHDRMRFTCTLAERHARTERVYCLLACAERSTTWAMIPLLPQGGGRFNHLTPFKTEKQLPPPCRRTDASWTALLRQLKSCLLCSWKLLHLLNKRTGL